MEVKIFWGTILRDLRKRNHLTQADVARILHMTRQNYSNMECGRIQPSVEDIAILCEIYEVDLYRHAINTMPEEMVAEQTDFKLNMCTKLAEIESDNSTKPKARKRRKPIVISPELLSNEKVQNDS